MKLLAGIFLTALMVVPAAAETTIRLAPRATAGVTMSTSGVAVHSSRGQAGPRHSLVLLSAPGKEEVVPDRELLTLQASTAAVPEVYGLGSNYPNPFNPTTTIQFTVAEQGPVRLVVYAANGGVVRVLVDGDRSPGQIHAVEWDGRNHAGQAVASGVYFYRLSARSFSSTRKMVLLK